MSGLVLLAQAADPTASPALPAEYLQWFYLWGEPSVTLGRSWGGLVTWSKVVGLYCLMAWVVGWLIGSARSNTVGSKPSPAKLGLLVGALVLGVVAALLGVLEENGRTRLAPIFGVKPAVWLGLGAGLVLVLLVEVQLWGTIRRREARADLLCLVGIHVAFAFGYFVAYRWAAWDAVRYAGQRASGLAPEQIRPVLDWRQLGARIGGTYMGLVVLLRVLGLMAGELAAIRFRRLYSIAWQSVVEATRVARAPYVVVAVFVVILAFTHWFLRAQEREAEISQMFVGALTLLCSLLLGSMIIFTVPQGMPRDITNQTIYTVVSKPVRRLELIWGRLIGYMALVTFLIALFGAISLIYIDRTVRYRVEAAREEGRKYEASRPEHSKLMFAQADQLAGRLSARVPLYGALAFLDAKSKAHSRGIDVGQEEETRSFVEGATESRAVWRYDLVPDPYSPGGMRDTRVPVESLLVPGTLEAVEDEVLTLADEKLSLDQQKGEAKTTAAEVAKLSARSSALAERIVRLSGELNALRAREKTVRDRIEKLPPAQRRAAREEELDPLHTPALRVQMTFTIYRTTKGVIGEPVLASLRVTNPRPGMIPFPTVIPVREYYTNETAIPSRVLVGSHGRLAIEVRCVTANQYLGMSEVDLYVLAGTGGFRLNFLKGLFGIWLQMLVLTAIGLFAGTFLSWPVAVLTTVFFFVAGEVAFSLIMGFAVLSPDHILIGPFESLIRILGQQNMQNALAATPAVVVAKTADSLVLPVMSRLVFLVPNFGALDVTSTVAEGFAVSWTQIRDLTLIGLGYALPFSVAAYFILKNREVAA